jgi:EmrB/QacA subfamily drug resistance transporter
VSISYLVSLAVFVPASGWLGDRYGGKRVLLTSIAVFTGASALCGTAGSLEQLVLYRVLQGAGGGMLVSVGMAMLFRAYPPGERVRISAVLSIANGLAPTLGPVVGGLLVGSVSWRAIFYVNVPVGAAALVFGLLRLRDRPARPAERFDLTGFLLSGAGLGLLMYGVSEGPERGWGTAPVPATLIAGVLLTIATVVVELRRRHPLLDFRLLTDRLLASGTAVMAVESVCLLGAVYTMTLYFQDGRGLSPVAAGLSTVPQALGIIAGSQLASRYLYRRLRPRRHLLLGVAGTGGSVALMALPGPGSGLWWARGLLFAMGLSVGQVFTATQSASMAGIGPAGTGRASTLFNVGRRVGSALGVALATTVLVAFGGPDSAASPAPGAFRAAFLACAAAALLLGLPAAARVRDADAVSTYRQQPPTPAPEPGSRPTPQPEKEIHS